MTNTKPETPLDGEILSESGNDLDHFRPSASSKRLDDKAATLEAEISGLKTSFARERFIHIFISTLLFIMALGPNLSVTLLSVLIVGAVVFLLGMGKYLDFPWIVLPLERWHDMVFNAANKRLNGYDPTTVEPKNDDGTGPKPD